MIAVEVFASETLTPVARKYLRYIVDNPEVQPRLILLEDSAGSRALRFGDFTEGSGSYDGLWFGIEMVLDAALNNAEIPLSWKDEWDYVEQADGDNAYGYVWVGR